MVNELRFRHPDSRFELGSIVARSLAFDDTRKHSIKTSLAAGPPLGEGGFEGRDRTNGHGQSRRDEIVRVQPDLTLGKLPDANAQAALRREKGMIEMWFRMTAIQYPGPLPQNFHNG